MPLHNRANESQSTPDVRANACDRNLSYASIGTGVAYLTRRSLFMSVDLPTFDRPMSATDGPKALYVRASIALGADATNTQLFLLKAFFVDCRYAWDILRELKPPIASSSAT